MHYIHRVVGHTDSESAQQLKCDESRVEDIVIIPRFFACEDLFLENRSHMHSNPFLRSVSSYLCFCLSNAFNVCPIDKWAWYLVLSSFKCQSLPFSYTSLPGDQWCDVLCHLHPQVVRQALQHFGDASLLWWLLCLPVCLLGLFSFDLSVPRAVDPQEPFLLNCVCMRAHECVYVCVWLGVCICVCVCVT